MGKLKEISSFKKRELRYELGKEGPNNYAIMFKGKKTFWKVVSSKSLADRIVATLKSKGKDAKVSLTAAPVTETIVRKNKTGMMGSKTQVHTDKKKEQDKTAARKKVTVDENEMKEEIEKDLEEGVDDPAIFKAVFLAGGPGSGKSFTVGTTTKLGKTGLSALGFRIVNSDEVFEFALKKAGLEPTTKNIFSPKGQKIRKGAKKLTAVRMDLYLDGRLGLVIDGTGKDFTKIQKQATDLKKLGYDVAMIFINANLETSIARDAKRERTLGAVDVKKMWQEVQDNIGKFQNFFGVNFTIVDNSEGSNWQKATLGAYKKVRKFAESPVKSPIAKKWIKDAGGRLKDSFSIDMQRKIAMVEYVLGDVDINIQIAESITLQSKPSQIKEIGKKLYGKHDERRNT